MIVLIPAAGSGVRFKELGRQYPKAILPYKERPILVRNIEMLLQSIPVKQILITTGHQSEKIEWCLNTFLRRPVREGLVKTCSYKEVDGKGGPAVSIFNAYQSSDFEADDVLILLGDLLVEKLCDFRPHDSFVSVRPVSDWKRWCMVSSTHGLASELYDKPQTAPPTNLALTGVYRFSNGELFRHVLYESIKHVKPTQTNEIEISSFLRPYLQSEQVRIESEIELLDFGTLEDYLRNRGIRNSRNFNEVTTPSDTTVRKRAVSSNAAQKLVEEISWFRNLPHTLAHITPRMFDFSTVSIGDSSQPEYILERISHPTLRDYLLFLESDVTFWSEIFSLLRSLIDKFQGSSHQYGHTFWSSLAARTEIRRKQLPENLKVNYPPFELLEVVDSIDNLPGDSFFHGDMTLSNILFDSGQNRIWLIDPMGPLIGNILYDVAKLMQCFVYNYDFIDAEIYAVEQSKIFLYSAGKETISESFESFVADWFGEDICRFVHYLVSLQFLNMIPLHSHNQVNQRMYLEQSLLARERSGLCSS